MKEHYSTTLQVKVELTDKRMGIEVTDLNEEKTPPFCLKVLNADLLKLGYVTHRAAPFLIQEYPELKNQFNATLKMTYEKNDKRPNTIELNVESEGWLSICLARLFQAYSSDPTFFDQE